MFGDLILMLRWNLKVPNTLGVLIHLNPKNSFCFFDQFLQFLTYLEEFISLPKKKWELEEVTIES
jgi:hypothetical protein